MYKIGDKVEFIEDFSEYAQKGDKGIIIDVYGDGSIFYIQLEKNSKRIGSLSYRIQRIQNQYKGHRLTKIFGA